MLKNFACECICQHYYIQRDWLLSNAVCETGYEGCKLQINLVLAY